MAKPIELDRSSYKNVMFNVDLLGGDSDEVARAAEAFDNQIFLVTGGEQDKNAKDFLAKLSPGRDFKSVGEMKSFVSNSSENEDERHEVDDNIQFLAQVAFLAMRDGERVDDFRDVLGKGEVSGIEAMLPESMKGLGKRIRNLMITDNDIQGVLDKMEKSRRRFSALPQKRKNEEMARLLEDGLMDLGEMEKSGDDEEQRIMIMAYFQGEWGRYDGGKDKMPIEMSSGVSKEVTDTVSDKEGNVSGRPTRIIQAPIGEKGGMEQAAALETMEMLNRSEMLAGMSREDVLVWASKIMGEMSKSPLFFAGQWQYAIPQLESSLRQQFGVLSIKLKDRRVREEEVNKGLKALRQVVETTVAANAIFAADGTIGGLINFLPPDPVIDEYGMSLMSGLKEEPIVKWVRDTMTGDIKHDGGRGGRFVVKWLRKEKLNEYLDGDDPGGKYDAGNPRMKGLRERIRKSSEFADLKTKYGDLNDDNLDAVLKLGINYWVFNDYPKVAIWVGSRKISEERAIDAGSLQPNEAKFGWVNSMAMEGRQINRYHERGRVYSLSSQIGQTTGIDHPLVSMREPMGILLVKNTWNKEVIDIATEGLNRLFVRLYMWDKATNSPTKSQTDPCEMGYKQLKRWDDMWGNFFGKGSQGQEIDDFKTFEDGLYNMQNLITSSRTASPVLPDLGGYVTGRILLAKTMALLSEHRNGEIENLVKGLALDKFSVPAEVDQAVKGLVGSVGKDFGVLKEAVSGLGFNFKGVKDIDIALAMLITETSDPELARENLRYKSWILGVKALYDVANSSGGGKKR